MTFFGQKHGLTPLSPLKKCYFLDFEKFCFLRSKKVSFFSAKLESIISRLFSLQCNLSVISTLIVTKSE